jgi:hypothetical protein
MCDLTFDEILLAKLLLNNMLMKVELLSIPIEQTTNVLLNMDFNKP